VGANLRLGVKKIPSPVTISQSAEQPSPVLTGQRIPLRQDGGGGSGVFSICVRRSSFFLEYPGPSYSLQVEFFFKGVQPQLITYYITLHGEISYRIYENTMGLLKGIIYVL
jgi:hypothetical protein